MLNIGFGRKGEHMKKLKKMDVKAGQTVYSFKCPCGVCPDICFCITGKDAQVSYRRLTIHNSNVRNGGSASGGAG